MNQKLPAKVSYALLKNVKELNKELDNFNTTRDKMYAEFWPPKPDGKGFEIPEKDYGKRDGIIEELLDTDIIPILHLISFSQQKPPSNRGSFFFFATIFVL